MPAVVVTPVVMAPMAIVTDASRSVSGPDGVAAAVGVIIRVIIIVRRAIEETPVKAVVPERDPVVAKATTAEHMPGSKPAAMEYGAAASETAAVNGRAATAVVTASPAKMATAAADMATATAAADMATATTAATTAAAAMAATDFGRQSFRRKFSRGHGARIDQRQRLCALTRRGRQRE